MIPTRRPSPYITHRIIRGFGVVERISHRREAGARCAICRRRAFYQLGGLVAAAASVVWLVAVRF